MDVCLYRFVGVDRVGDCVDNWTACSDSRTRCFDKVFFFLLRLLQSLSPVRSIKLPSRTLEPFNGFYCSSVFLSVAFCCQFSVYIIRALD